jgi:hypothetical protein
MRAQRDGAGVNIGGAEAFNGAGFGKPEPACRRSVRPAGSRLSGW